MKFQHLLLVAAYCACLFWLSSGPVDVPPSIQFNGVDKVAHMCVYAGLAGLVSRGLRQSGRPWAPRALFWIPVLFASLYGASDEFHQYFVPTRSCDVFDWLADTTGGLVAVSALSLFLRLIGKPAAETLTGPGE